MWSMWLCMAGLGAAVVHEDSQSPDVQVQLTTQLWSAMIYAFCREANLTAATQALVASFYIYWQLQCSANLAMFLLYSLCSRKSSTGTLLQTHYRSPSFAQIGIKLIA